MDKTVQNSAKKEKADQEKGQRIAKVIAAAGLCSRREAETRIEEGRVEVNGKRLDTPAFLVTEQDSIKVDGKLVSPKQRRRLFVYHKIAGQVTTTKDTHARETVFDALPKNLPRLISVGRLDLNSEGLLLLTTDGALSRYLELPSTGLARTYRVRVFGAIDEDRLDGLKKGITLDGIHYGSINARVERKGSRNAWLVITLHEGKNREIRKVMRALDLQVNRLIRVSYGPFELKDLKQGEIIEVPEAQIRSRLPGAPA